jgi:pyruvate,orthophosphate dikinase
MGGKTSKRTVQATRRGGGAGPQARRADKLVYSFGDGRADGRSELRNLLGGKGANLAEMSRLGVPVPPGFTITTEVCTHFRTHGGQYPPGLRSQVEDGLARMEKILGRRFGDPRAPMLLSVRSGARASMPGMMDTVLNLGLSASTVTGLIRESGSARFGYDCYRRFVQMFGDVVLGLRPAATGEGDPFEETIEKRKSTLGVALDSDLGADDLRDLAESFKQLINDRLHVAFPENPHEQLWASIGAVFRSWDNARANTYRRLNRIPDDWGTAVNIQAMVFGNLGDDCATGVAFTRSPATGSKGIYGEFLVNAQGEDVVAGTRTPQQITRIASIEQARASGTSDDLREPSLQELMPRCHRELTAIARQLEHHYREMQDLEFTIERGKLWILQTRTGKRTAGAAVKIAVDMVGEKLIDRRTAVLRVTPTQLDQLLHPQIDPNERPASIGKGLPASPGAASGEVVFSADQAVHAVERGKRVVLVRIETSPEDIHGMNVAEGILTARGGMTSHAAVVARGMGKCCISGCNDLQIDYGAQTARIGTHDLRLGDWITLDGSSGEIYAGTVATTIPALGGDFRTFMQWADNLRQLRIRANADTPRDAEAARLFGAEGIGLCRTEHMFFEGNRIDTVREMILATDLEARERALAKLLPMQRQDFLDILRVMAGLPVTIRLLDPPLHEFLPTTDAELSELASTLGTPIEGLRAARDSMAEVNPMLGLRGCRLGITYPEIYAMQVRAIGEATCELRREGLKVFPEIMIPLVSHVRELATLRSQTLAILAETAAQYGLRLTLPIGTMIELPRAALTAGEIATEAEFFSFGTNDLTQSTFGLSRDDSGRFLPNYIKRGVLPEDPFAVLDRKGVGELIAIAVERGRASRSDIKLGVCGEHGGEPSSVAFFHHLGLDYVSCSPYRVPVARLAAAHAALGVDPAP